MVIIIVTLHTFINFYSTFHIIVIYSSMIQIESLTNLAKALEVHAILIRK